MHRLRWLLVVLLFCPGCRNPREEARRRVDAVGAETLRHEAALLYKQMHGSAVGSFAVVSEKQWPNSFRRIDPVRVGCYADGFSLALRTEADAEQGIYVVPTDFVRREPAEVRHTRFEPLAGGVYWYEFER